MAADRLPFTALSRALGHPTRWTILSELTGRDARSSAELGKKVRLSTSALAKHLTILLDCGIIERRHRVLYQLATRYQPAPGSREVDLGACVLRFD